MEREVGGGIGMGNTCKPLAVSFQCMTKSTTNKISHVVTKKKKKKKSGILSYRVAPKGSIDVPVENLPESHYILRAIQSPHFEKKCRYSY